MSKLLQLCIVLLPLHVYCENIGEKSHDALRGKAVEANVGLQDEDLKASSTENCRVMEISNYTQESAPEDISVFETIVFDYLMERLENVTRVAFAYTGNDIHGTMIGPRQVKTLVQRRHQESNECIYIRYNILDTNECTTTNRRWKHKCHSSSQCVNTNGSYECACKAGHFGAKGQSPSSSTTFSLLGASSSHQQPAADEYCYGHSDTTDCCHLPEFFSQCDVEQCIAECKSKFHCINDPCAAASCPAHSTCFPSKSGAGHSSMWASTEEKRNKLLGGYECKCNLGYREDDNGNCVPTVKPDWCAGHACPCNCQCVPDEKRAGYTCIPEPGYKKYYEPVEKGHSGDQEDDNSTLRLDKGICIHAVIPTLELIGNNPYILKQGDDYVEHGAQVSDSNLEKSRERKMTVSFPDKALGRCLSTIGEYRVHYEVNADWLNGDVLKNKKTSITRKVLVEDVDECTYAGRCKEFIHDCSHEASCHNTVGSFECKCPDGYIGDGKRNGRGCIDARPPTIECHGAGCASKHFRVADVHAFHSDDDQVSDIASSDRDYAKSRVKQIFETGRNHSGNDTFCETQHTPCFVAYDEVLLNGTRVHIDLTSNITMIDLEEVPDSNSTVMKFNVLYLVSDSEGNSAMARRQVLVTRYSNYMIWQLTRQRVVFVLSRLFFYFISIFIASTLLFILWILRNSVSSFFILLPIIFAYLFLPSSFVINHVSRKTFIDAVNLWLVISRFGFLDKHHRLSLAFQEWTDIQNQSDT